MVFHCLPLCHFFVLSLVFSVSLSLSLSLCVSLCLFSVSVSVCLSVLSLFSQVVHEDIEVISDAISKLESFHLARDPLQATIEELLEKLKQFSPSAITSELIAGKEKEFEVSNGMNPLISFPQMLL